MQKAWCFVALFVICASDLAGTVRGDSENACSEESGDCQDNSDKNAGQGWKPFRILSQDKWIAFDRIAGKYAEWHEKALQNDELPCKSKKILVFSPNAGLGDSVGALTTAYMYALRAGRLFFIDWRPYPWSVMFKELPFHYNYRKALNMTDKYGKPLLCPDENDATSFLQGHITSGHPMAREAERQNFHTAYDDISNYFLQPSEEVQKIMKDVVDGPFDRSSLDDGTILHKVAIVMRTGIGEYNQFLSLGDEKNFVTCFENYARKYKDKVKSKKVKFVVFVASDNSEAKQNCIEALEKNFPDLNVQVATLEDSVVHIMHLTPQQAKKVKIRTKLRKTIAEFFLIGMCDARFLTHGSLFGRTAAERGGGPENNNFFISDSNCDGKREKYSYLQCHEPKYPPICGFS